MRRACLPAKAGAATLLTKPFADTSPGKQWEVCAGINLVTHGTGNLLTKATPHSCAYW